MASIRWPNIVRLQERLLRLYYMRHGLRLVDVHVDEQTTVACWAPRRFAEASTRRANPQRVTGGETTRREAISPLAIDDRRRETREERKPPLLMLHGFGASATWQWTNQVAPLSARFDLFLPDLVFFGGSRSSGSSRSEEWQAETMLGVMDQLGVDTCPVLGLSYGGFVAYSMARLSPHRIPLLVLAAAGGMTEGEEHKAMLDTWQVSHISDLLLPTSPAGVQRLVDLAYADEAPKIPKWILQSALEVLFDMREEKHELLDELLQYLEGGKERNHPPPEMETLILWGEKDSIFPVSAAERMQRHFNDKSCLVVLDGASHALNVHRPGAFNQSVLNFLLK